MCCIRILKSVWTKYVRQLCCGLHLVFGLSQVVINTKEQVVLLMFYLFTQQVFQYLNINIHLTLNTVGSKELVGQDN